MPATSSSAVDRLTDINLADLMDAAGLLRLQATPARHLFRPAARRFALTAHEFDRRVGRHGLASGSAWLMDRMTAGLRSSGLEHIPADGPVMVLSNHPGMTDTVALFSSLALLRPDLRVIALDRPFLRALPHVAQQLIFLGDDETGPMNATGAMRAGTRHLQAGGALLTFPAGTIEPDPAAFGAERAVASLADWSTSYTVFARLVPQTRFIPALVSHVISAQAQRHPLTLLRRSAHNREKLATALQVAWPRYRRLVARVRYGAPHVVGAADERSLADAIAAQMRALILDGETAR